ncbi:MAG: ATP phosphoribosyltransferase [Candidatus Marinimicrobia bacterium]|nr:ATP phosphoribosyltransferase [Candidatus Neomarinimicrobiota bacterium]
MNESRLKIAVQRSGRLSDATLQILERCGLKINPSKNKLITHVKNMPIDILFVRDDDIPGLVMEGFVDLGFVGENTMQEVSLQRAKFGENALFENLIKLDYGHCRLSLATPEENQYINIRSLEGSRIATSYPYLLGEFLKKEGVSAKIVHLTGSVEVAPRAGLADAICDLVSTGVTLEANGLREVEVMLRSSATLVQRMDIAPGPDKELIARLIVRIKGVIKARESKYIMLHAPLDKVDAIIDILPGAEKPTILPLAGSDKQVAIHAVSTETVFWETMESLKKLGGSSILVLPIEKMLE